MTEIKEKVQEAEKDLKEAVETIEEAKDTVIESCEKNSNLLGAAKDLEKAEDAALVATEAVEEAKFKLN
jgi:hypothetical protein